MYLKYYKLRADPFNGTPDPEFLFMSDAHKEALASLVYAVEGRKGFATLVGEVGTGKTTILQAFLGILNLSDIERFSYLANPANWAGFGHSNGNGAQKNGTRAPRDPRCAIYYIFNANVSFLELLQAMLPDSKETTEAKLVWELQEVLIARYRVGLNSVLVVDEAQHMPIETLERMRLLTNLETSKDKLLQVVLAGQPELDEKLNLQQLRQFKQRISIRAKTRPLTRVESYNYVNHRLGRVSWGLEPVFDKRALDRIVRRANGYPRVLNILCDNALIAGFGRQSKPVTARIVKEVIAEFA